jgi:hypothetical protein
MKDKTLILDEQSTPMGRFTAASLIEAIRSRGSDARDLRDAAHEAHHAIVAGVRGPWDREVIHRALMRKGKSFAQDDEVMARAVEQIVCADLGVDCGDVDTWAFLACMEALKGGNPIGNPDAVARAIRLTMKTDKARKAADAVMGLAAAPLVRKRIKVPS